MTIGENKPRKAKYGFTMALNQDTLKDAAILHSVLANIPQADADAQDVSLWWIETPNNMGTSQLKLYINDEGTYAKVKAAIEADEIVQPKLTLALPVYRKHPGYYVEIASDEVEGDERIVCIAIGKYDDVPDSGVRHRDDLLKQALHHLDEHMREYHHVTPPELLEEIKKVIA